MVKMARQTCIMTLMAILTFSVAATAVVATSKAPPPDCSDVEVSLMSCLDYLEDGSNSTSPTKDCCTAAATVIKKSPECICSAIKDYSDLINITRALDLPSACSLKTPQLPCQVSTPPSPAPSPTPMPPPVPSQRPAPASPAQPSAPASLAQPSSQAPTPGPSSSEAPSIRACVMIIASLTTIIFSILKS